MKNHTDLLNYLATTFNLQSYLEIGVYDRKNNFNIINLPWRQKFCIDPDPKAKADFIGTSDEYFEDLSNKWDLIFIDGLHHADQVKRDFENSLKCLTENGFIVIHDTNPEKEEYTHVPRDSKIWNGDVYKFACTLRTYKDIDFCTLPFDHGCTIVWRNKHLKFDDEGAPFETWAEFSKNKKGLLRMATQVYFKELMEDVSLIFNYDLQTS